VTTIPSWITEVVWITFLCIADITRLSNRIFVNFLCGRLSWAPFQT
jgi:hypothetical protein